MGALKNSRHSFYDGSILPFYRPDVKSNSDSHWTGQLSWLIGKADAILFPYISCTFTVHCLPSVQHHVEIGIEIGIGTKWMHILSETQKRVLGEILSKGRCLTGKEGCSIRAGVWKTPVNQNLICSKMTSFMLNLGHISAQPLVNSHNQSSVCLNFASAEN